MAGLAPLPEPWLRRASYFFVGLLTGGILMAAAVALVGWC